MSKIRIDLESPVYSGQPVTFRSPADCSEVDGLLVYYYSEGVETSSTFQFADAHGQNVGSVSLFASNVLVKVILDTDLNRAYVQNADTNAYLESHIQNKENPHGVTLEQVGAAPKSHKHTVSQISDFPSSMPASDVPAWAKAASKPTYTASEVGARPSTWTPSASDVGAAPSSHKHTKSQITDFPSSMPASDVYDWAKQSKKPTYTASEVGARPSTWTPSASDVGAAPSSHTHDDRYYTESEVNNLLGGKANATAAGLNGMLANGATVLSAHQYGTSLPSAGTAGRIFFKKA